MCAVLPHLWARDKGARGGRESYIHVGRRFTRLQSCLSRLRDSKYRGQGDMCRVYENLGLDKYTILYTIGRIT